MARPHSRAPMHVTVGPHSMLRSELEAMIVRAEASCERCRLALEAPGLPPWALRHRRTALQIAKASLARLKALRNA